MPDRFALTNEQRAWGLCLLAEVHDDLDEDKLFGLMATTLPGVDRATWPETLRIIGRLRSDDPENGYNRALEYVTKVMSVHTYVPRHLAQA